MKLLEQVLKANSQVVSANFQKCQQSCPTEMSEEKLTCVLECVNETTAYLKAIDKKLNDECL